LNFWTIKLQTQEANKHNSMSEKAMIIISMVF